MGKKQDKESVSKRILHISIRKMTAFLSVFILTISLAAPIAAKAGGNVPFSEIEDTLSEYTDNSTQEIESDGSLTDDTTGGSTPEIVESLDYVLGRPMTEDEEAEQLRITEEMLSSSGGVFEITLPEMSEPEYPILRSYLPEVALNSEPVLSPDFSSIEVDVNGAVLDEASIPSSYMVDTTSGSRKPDMEKMRRSEIKGS